MALSLLVQLPFANKDFDIGLESIIGARFQGPIQRAWVKGGFLNLAGRPMLTPLPTRPPKGLTYASHPPLAHWLFHLPVSIFGLSEFSLRLIPILFTAFAGFLLATFLAMRLGPIAGVTSSLLWPSWPMVFFYGRMANYESLVFAFALSACLLVLRNSKKSIGAAAFCLFLGTMTDWAAGFFLPGIALICWQRKLGWRPLLTCGVGVAVGVFAYLCILVGWEGSMAGAIKALNSAKNMAQATESFGLFAFAKAQVKHLTLNFGIGGTALAVIASLLACLRLKEKKTDDLDLLILASLSATIINIGLFPARAFNHDFWTYYFLLAVTIAAVRFASALFRRKRLIGAFILGALVLEGADRIKTRYETENVGESNIIAAQVDQRFGPKDLVVMEGNFGSWQFVCDAWIYDSIDRVDVAKALIDDFLAGKLDVEHLGFWYPIVYDFRNPALLEHWKSLGATYEAYGESAILTFHLPKK